jgi:hypothetical protein
MKGEEENALARCDDGVLAISPLGTNMKTRNSTGKLSSIGSKPDI